ncbi:LamG domain-containing protein [Alienimonas sp. DA493]|uniref:LamG domain-containing protein n=1 Tax=Alienimonas sp. DA493 TaxID=3373605 RepID=UPI003753ECD4
MRFAPLVALAPLAVLLAPGGPAVAQSPRQNEPPAAGFVTVAETPDAITVETDALSAVIPLTGYVSGVKSGSLKDKKTGATDLGFGLHIMDFLMAPGWREDGYERDPALHGDLPKHYVEGPQLCTQAKRLEAHVTRGDGFAAVRLRHRFHEAGEGYQPGSIWEQTLLFRPGLRYVVTAERIVSVNAVDDLFYRIDMPGHVRHGGRSSQNGGGQTFERIYLSYEDDSIPAAAFTEPFGPDERFLYQRRDEAVPERMIRAYQVRLNGEPGPWLAGMTLDPAAVAEAWCHQRGYVCFIQELHRRDVRAGEAIGAAYVVGWFDDRRAMRRTYDEYRGVRGIELKDDGFELTPAVPPATGVLATLGDWPTSAAAGPADAAARRAAPGALPGLLAFWDFQEPTGTNRVSSGRDQYALQERNGPIARVEDGVFGPYSVDFELGQWFLLPHEDAPGLDLHGEDQEVSMVAWIKRQNNQHWQYLAGMWNELDHARQYGLFMSGSWQTDWTTYQRVRAVNQAMGYVSPFGGATPGHPFAFDYATGATPIPVDRWTMLSYSFDGEAIRVYVNGELDENGPYNPFQYDGGMHDGGSDFTVAQRAVPKWPTYPEGRPTNDAGFDGRLAGLAVYDRALTAEEMRRLYEQTMRPAGDGAER